MLMYAAGEYSDGQTKGLSLSFMDIWKQRNGTSFKESFVVHVS